MADDLADRSSRLERRSRICCSGGSSTAVPRRVPDRRDPCAPSSGPAGARSRGARDLEALGSWRSPPSVGSRPAPNGAELCEVFVVRAELPRCFAPARSQDGCSLMTPTSTGCSARDAALRRGHPRGRRGDAAFHGFLVELAGNATLARVWRRWSHSRARTSRWACPGPDRRRIADAHGPISMPSWPGCRPGRRRCARHFARPRPIEHEWPRRPDAEAIRPPPGHRWPSADQHQKGPDERHAPADRGVLLRRRPARA
jgi:hypothetical protein